MTPMRLLHPMDNDALFCLLHQAQKGNEENNMKKWQNGAVAAALMFSILATGCGEKIDQTASVEVTTTTALETPTEAPTEAPELTERAKKLLAQNPDTVGYITISGTQVDNPVVQTVDDEYYLDHGFDGQEFRAGTVFMDCTDVFGADPAAWSENIILYGHNMADNTMFGSLRRYRQDPSYYKEAPFITFSSNYADYTYVIFGLIITGGDADSDFLYWNMEELDDKATFDSYVNSVEAKNMIDNPLDVQFGDSILTLSTCYSDEDNSRFLVVARRLREGEDTDTLLATIQGGGTGETAPAQE